MKTKSLGQIAYEAAKKTYGNIPSSWDTSNQTFYEAAASAVEAEVLARFWRPVSDPPENPEERVLVISANRDVNAVPFHLRNKGLRTHWAHIPPVTKADAFEEAFQKIAPDVIKRLSYQEVKDIARAAYNAALESKEK